MLSLPFPSPDTVTIATQVFQSGRSMWRGTEVPFWKEWEGSLAWKVVSWWFLLPQGRKLLCDNHLANLALQWATRPLGVGICFVQPPKCGCVCRVPSFYLLISWEQCISRVCVLSLMCHPLYSISSCAENSLYFLFCKALFWYHTQNQVCWLDIHLQTKCRLLTYLWKSTAFSTHQHLWAFPLFLTLFESVQVKLCDFMLVL